MDDQIFPPAEPVSQPEPAPEQPVSSEPDEKVMARRDEEIRRASELGQKRFQKEKAIKQKIITEKATLEARQHKAAAEGAKMVEEHKEATKGYRKEFKQRQKDVEADRLRREAERKHAEELRLEAIHKREEEKKYLNELHAAANVKYDRERAEFQLKAKKEKGRHDANAKAQAAYNEIERERGRRRDQIEHEAAARRGIIDTEAKNKVYQLEALKRMQLSEFDNMMRSKINALAALKDRDEIDRRKRDLEIELKTKRKAMDADWEKKKAGLDLEARLKHEASDTQRRTELNASDVDARHKRYEVDLTLGRDLDEVARLKK